MTRWCWKNSSPKINRCQGCAPEHMAADICLSFHTRKNRRKTTNTANILTWNQFMVDGDGNISISTVFSRARFSRSLSSTLFFLFFVSVWPYSSIVLFSFRSHSFLFGYRFWHRSPAVSHQLFILFVKSKALVRLLSELLRICPLWFCVQTVGTIKAKYSHFFTHIGSIHAYVTQHTLNIYRLCYQIINIRVFVYFICVLVPLPTRHPTWALPYARVVIMNAEALRYQQRHSIYKVAEQMAGVCRINKRRRRRRGNRSQKCFYHGNKWFLCD